MYKLDKIKSMFNCKLCSKLLVDPVTISCGQIVCRYHVPNLNVNFVDINIQNQMTALPQMVSFKIY